MRRAVVFPFLAWVIAMAGPLRGAAAEFALPPPDAKQPLAPVLQWATTAIARVEKDIPDYTAVLARRESVAGNLEPEPKFLFLKVRHNPFSVYVYVLSPAGSAGNEAIYVEGRNDGNLIGHAGSGLYKYFGTHHLKPTSPFAMDGNHPITEIGILHLLRQIEAFAKQNVGQSGCTVEALPGASVNGRKATCVRVAFPLADAKSKALLIRVFVDDKLGLPIRYEAYDWPRAAGATPQLLEEYTYLNLRLNPGLTDADFDPKNKNYAF
jgi:hypothetical protein